jgi:ABC-2 type transport system permease protein
MVGALLYLRGTSAKNWALQRITRLRQPKYLLGAIVGVAYFWFFFFRRMMVVPVGHSGAAVPAVAAQLQMLPLLFIFLPVVLIGVIRLIVVWIAPSNNPGLLFSEAEVSFLFPAPITRRMLVNYRLLSAQVTILISAIFVALISNSWRMLGGNAFTHAIGWWLILSTFSLHLTGASFTVTRLIAGGVSKITRQIVVTTVVVTILAIVVYTIWRTAPAPTEAEMAKPLGLMSYVAGLTDFGALRWVSLPFKIVLGPFLAPDWPEFWSALGPALLLLIAHYIWVMQAETSFEEASIALAEKRTAMIAAMQQGKFRLGGPQTKGRRAPFRLASAGGRPELAFLWKNLLSTRPYFTPRVFGICAAVLLIGHGWLSKGGEGERTTLAIVGTLASITAAYTVLLGPRFARQDFRSDLGNADLFKTYPLRGWQVVLGELLTPVAILTGIFWLALLAAALGSGSMGKGASWLTPEFRAAAAISLGLIAPVFFLLQFLVPNAATLLFPSWAQTTRARERGIDVMGQRLIFVFGQLLVVIIAVLPAVLVGVLLWFAANWVFGEVASTIIATAGVLAILAVEVVLGISWLGWRFEQLDLSSETVK